MQRPSSPRTQFPRLHHRLWCGPALSRTLLSALLLSGAHAVAQAAPTRVAISAAATLPGGGFENGAIPSQAYNPVWPGWTFTPQSANAGSGIARNGAPVLQNSNPAPAGSYVAFLEGQGVVATNVSVPAGSFRIRFTAAQRIRGALPNQQILRVDLGGTTVFEQMLPNGIFTDYFTDVIHVASPSVLPLQFVGLAGQGLGHAALLDKVKLDPVLLWNSSSTWGASPPLATDTVSIPAGTVVAMNGACVAAWVEVRGDLLADPQGAALDCRWLMVTGAGSSLQVGTANAPFPNSFVLTLVGSSSTENIMGAGTKFLMAMDGGTIDMHGQPKTSWTKLTQVNGTSITVASCTNWAVGDRLVVAPSSWAPSFPNTPLFPRMPFSEVRTIVSISPATRQIVMDQAFTPGNPHHAGAPVTYSNPLGVRTWSLDQRAEVGMLTHNVVIRGEPSPSTMPDDDFGGHVMIMNCPMCNTPGVGRFANIQLLEMGQRSPNLPKVAGLGRYPMHWHMQMANGAGQYLRGCSVEKSYNRAVTIHGSDYVTVEDNVLYDHVGHGVFLEDGGERYNRILGNLVLATKRPTNGTELLQTDNSHDEPQNRTPAAFWITNPQNDFVGNVAADTVGTGYWFALHRRPFDLSGLQSYYTNPLVNGTRLDLGMFRDNVAHSCRMAIDLNDSVDPDPNAIPGGSPNSLDDILVTNFPWQPPTPAILERFLAYGCATALYAGGGNDRVIFDDCVLADNEWDVQFACPFTIRNSLLVENSGNGLFAPQHPAFSGVAYMPYDGPGRLIDSHLVGFDGAASPHATTVSSVFGAAQRHTGHLLNGLTFAPTSGPPRIDFYDFTLPGSPQDSRHWGIAVRNPDSSLSQFAVPSPDPYPGSVGLPLDRTLVSNHPMMRMANGAVTPDVQHMPGFNAWWSAYRWGYLRVEHYDVNGGLIGAQPDMTFVRAKHDGWTSASYVDNSIYDAHRQIPVVIRPFASTTASECWYTADWTPPPQARSIRVIMDDLEVGDVTCILLLNRSGWTNPSVTTNGAPVPSVPTPGQLNGLAVTTYALATPNLWLRMVNTGSQHKVIVNW